MSSSSHRLPSDQRPTHTLPARLMQLDPQLNPIDSDSTSFPPPSSLPAKRQAASPDDDDHSFHSPSAFNFLSNPQIHHDIPTANSRPDPSPLPPNSAHVFNNLAASLGLDPIHRDSALRICQAAGSDPQAQFYATICYMASLHQSVAQPPSLPHDSPPLPDGLTSAHWQPSKFLREHTRTQGLKIITQEDIQAYTATKDTRCHILPGCFQNRVIKHLQDQNPVFKQRLLPPGFGSPGASEASKQVLLFVKDIIKHNRENLRKLLLTNVLLENDQYSNKPIPTLAELVVLILSSFTPGTELQTPEEILQATPESQKNRFAYLRLEAIRFYAHPSSNKRLSQWGAIDQTLSSLRSQSSLYQDSFYELVREIDGMLFGHELFSSLKMISKFDLPTEEAIKERMEVLRLKRGGQTDCTPAENQ